MPKQLKSWRAKHDYTQVTLAEALGVVPITVSRWERGDREIPPFLHLALKWLEVEGGEKQSRKRTAKRGGKHHG